jgi:hypothetical protein
MYLSQLRLSIILYVHKQFTQTATLHTLHTLGCHFRHTAHLLLQVPLGSVTPLALVQPTAEKVVLLLDKSLQGRAALLVHPLTNTASLSLPAQGLETFLR